MKVIATSDEIMHQTPNTVLSSIADKMEGQIDVNHDGKPDIGWSASFKGYAFSFKVWLITIPDKDDIVHFAIGAVLTFLVKEYLL